MFCYPWLVVGEHGVEHGKTFIMCALISFATAFSIHCSVSSGELFLTTATGFLETVHLGSFDIRCWPGVQY